MPISQKNRPIKVSTPLGEDVLLFYRMHGTERLGGLFEYELDLLSENASIDPDKLLGENVTVGVSLPEGEWRYFNGYVAKFGQHDMKTASTTSSSPTPPPPTTSSPVMRKSPTTPKPAAPTRPAPTTSTNGRWGGKSSPAPMR